MTRQEMFTRAWNGVIRQGQVAVAPTGQCQYRTSTGLRCAVGQLLSERQAAELESSRPGGVADWTPTTGAS